MRHRAVFKSALESGISRDVHGHLARNVSVAKRQLDGVDERLQFSRGSADALPFRNEAFDAVLSMRFMPHIATQQRRIMLSEMARVSRRWVVFSNTYSNRWYEYRR